MYFRCALRYCTICSVVSGDGVEEADEEEEAAGLGDENDTPEVRMSIPTLARSVDLTRGRSDRRVEAPSPLDSPFGPECFSDAIRLFP